MAKKYFVEEDAEVRIQHTVKAKSKKEAIEKCKNGDVEKTEIIEYLGDSMSVGEVGLLSNYKKHQCQNCGCERKWVQTLIDDEFIWDEDKKEFVPNGFSDDFSHTGVETCCNCGKAWTGL